MMSQIRYSCKIQMYMLVIDQYFTVLLARGGGGGRDQNLVYLQKVVFCFVSMCS